MINNVFSLAEQWSSINYIAWQCPLKSASAVYKARGMYGIVEPFTRFDNYSICDSQGMQYRLAQENPEEEVIEQEKLMVYPNPNAGLLHLDLIGIDSPVNFEIVNTLGQTVHQWQHSDARQTIDLDKLQISAGMYYIRVIQLDGSSMQQKFIYQKQ